VKIQTSNFSSEYGRSSGAAFNVVTRNGTNQFHGHAIEYFRNDKLDARNFLRQIRRLCASMISVIVWVVRFGRGHRLRGKSGSGCGNSPRRCARRCPRRRFLVGTLLHQARPFCCPARRHLTRITSFLRRRSLLMVWQSRRSISSVSPRLRSSTIRMSRTMRPFRHRIRSTIAKISSGSMIR
jgi:hypothetical protein